jgi:hypothetical protein
MSELKQQAQGDFKDLTDKHAEKIHVLQNLFGPREVVATFTNGINRRPV